MKSILSSQIDYMVGELCENYQIYPEDVDSLHSNLIKWFDDNNYDIIDDL